jgi:hypothetical protein
LNGQLVYVGDGIKVGKEGNKMPGVKRLPQESANVSKAEWIRGHYFGAIGLPLGAGEALFAVPIAVQLQDGIQAQEAVKKIEVCFRTLIHLLGGFCYRFWLKPMPSAPRWSKDLPLASSTESFRQSVARKVEAFERFVNIPIKRRKIDLESFLFLLPSPFYFLLPPALCLLPFTIGSAEVEFSHLGVV